MTTRDDNLQRMTDEEVASVDEQQRATIHPTDMPDMVAREDGQIGDQAPPEGEREEPAP